MLDVAMELLAHRPARRSHGSFGLADLSTMNILINDKPYPLPGRRHAVRRAGRSSNATPPFAVAVNRQFVPRSNYAAHALQADDRIEVIRPVTGG